MPNANNRLVQRLPRTDRERLLGCCTEVELALRQVVAEPGLRTRHVYFPTDGFISLIAVGKGKAGVEVGMVGREGMLGAELVLGSRESIFHALVQGTGSALRVGADAFRRELGESDALRQLLQRYLALHMAQLATSVVCQRFHALGPRLARWLLMTQDRASDPQIFITHEFMAYMLGVRRVGVTVAAGDLQRRGLIDYRRGICTILDRGGLESAACACYATEQERYRDLRSRVRR